MHVRPKQATNLFIQLNEHQCIMSSYEHRVLQINSIFVCTDADCVPLNASLKGVASALPCVRFK